MCLSTYKGSGQPSEEGEPVLWPQGALSSCFGGCVSPVGHLRAPDTYHSYLSVFNLDRCVWRYTCSWGHNSCHIWGKLRSLAPDSAINILWPSSTHHPNPGPDLK